jgi:diguanylate cyclase (GGDEF)-like protein
MLQQDEDINTLQTVSKLASYEKQLKILEQKIVGEQLVREIARQIHQSRTLNYILHEAVQKLREFFCVNSVTIYRFKADWTSLLIAESVDTNYCSLAKKSLITDNFIAHYIKSYHQGKLAPTDSIMQEQINKFASNLIVPINKESELWGIIFAYNHTKMRPWESWEIELLEDVSLHLGIALNENELYRELQIANQELQELVFKDELTQINNIRYFCEIIPKEWQRAIREKQPISLIICDVDYFKQYNDTYGHQSGDECLRKVAQCIALSCQRPTDVVCRYGGEEFIIILPNTESSGAIYVAGEIRSRLRQCKIPHAKSKVSDHVTFSFGVASCIPEDDQDYNILLKIADQALYNGKNEGRDRIILAQNTP